MPKMIDPFEIPNDAKPYRMTYQWVRQSLMGMPDANHIKRSKMAGWRSIKRRRHKSMRAYDLWDDDTPWIEYGGLKLMERPSYMSDAARNEELAEAKSNCATWLSSHRVPRGNFLSRCLRINNAKWLWAGIKWLPQIEGRRLWPRLAYPFKKQ